MYLIFIMLFLMVNIGSVKVGGGMVDSSGHVFRGGLLCAPRNFPVLGVIFCGICIEAGDVVIRSLWVGRGWGVELWMKAVHTTRGGSSALCLVM